ncbi:hypothetical protein EPIR_1988 [Erwinia piriflorinigrans CFBP 5888]|uniref:Uncharacterized protein n=1 Tax=Erwinia piriflorinigrans CFBP 5888 TaxID=1161919 RepID=V5Z8S2_9GAMM|nr:hypothetical protein EPIR_1988 [Erwinia piriflorinigrans CFBP 5888]
MTNFNISLAHRKIKVSLWIKGNDLCFFKKIICHIKFTANNIIYLFFIDAHNWRA